MVVRDSDKKVDFRMEMIQQSTVSLSLSLSLSLTLAISNGLAAARHPKFGIPVEDFCTVLCLWGFRGAF